VVKTPGGILDIIIETFLRISAVGMLIAGLYIALR